MIRSSERTRRRAFAALCLGLTVSLAGCRHRIVLPPLPAVQTPVDLIESPQPANAPLLEAHPSSLPPVPAATAAPKPPRGRRRSRTIAPTSTPSAAPEPEATPPAAPAPEPPPAESAVGALTAGGEATPQTRQEAADLLASIDKRLNALPAQLTDAQKTQIAQVKNFSRDAQAALKSGDADGAKTLATKAKLILDDLEQ